LRDSDGGERWDRADRQLKVVFDRVSADRHVTTIVGFDEAGKEVRKLQLTFSRAR
jgi:hypothetical protein